jgi:hypothetical protein
MTMKAKMFEFCAAKNKNSELVAIGQASAQKDHDRRRYKNNEEHIRVISNLLVEYDRKLALAIRNNGQGEIEYFGQCRKGAKVVLRQFKSENAKLDKKYLG